MRKVGWVVVGVAVVAVMAAFFVQRFRIQPLTLPKNPPPRVLHILPAPPVLRVVDIGSVRQQLAREKAAALTRISRSRQNVTRTFIVGWEMHHGLFLVPLNSTSAKNWFLVDWIVPNFRDHALADKFAQQANPNGSTEVVHLGQPLICYCTGVPWRFYTAKQFLVRSATLEWQ